MKINNKSAVVLVLLVLITLGLSVVSAEDVDSQDITTVEPVETAIADDTVIDDNSNNIIKNTEKTQTKSSSNVRVSDYASLYDTINNIKNDTSTDEYTIDLDDGNYEVTTPITWGNSKKVKTLTINGNNQVINGNSKQFLTINSGYVLNLNNIVINGCENTKDGGAIINKGTLNLNTATLENNKANFGGAVYNSKNLTIKDSIFLNNSAVNGGAIANTNYAKTMILNTTFESNSVENIGGAIENEHYSNMEIYDSTFKYNTAVNGGAIDDNQATMILERTLFDSNNATDYAGAIYSRLFANVTMTNNTLINNYAGDDGGAIYNYFNSTFIGNRNLISNNKALMYGGAIYNDESEMFFTENNITDNEVITYGGGAVYNTNSGFGHFIDNYFANNIAKTNGGVVYVSASKLEFIGNIVKNNSARQSGALHLIQYCTVNVTDNIFINNSASTNAGAIYTNSLILMNISKNTFGGNRAADGAALFSTGGNVLFDSNILMNNFATTAGKKVISNTGTLISTNNEFLNNTDGTDMLMSESGTNTVYDNIYKANKLETFIEQIEDQPVISDFDLKINVSPKEVYNTTVDSGNIIVTLNGEEYYTGALADSTVVTIKLDDLLEDNQVEVKYTPVNDDFQESTMTFNMKSTNELKVSDYESLYDTIEKIKQDTKFDLFIINLEEGNYEVTTPIQWTNSLNAKSLLINGSGQEIKGNGKNFMSIDEEYYVVLDNITVSGCENNEDGGAITNDGGLVIINSTFKDNNANFGGAIVSHGVLTIIDSLFTNNSASNGGALANTNYATAGILNTTFDENDALTLGGAIYNEHQSVMNINKCTFTANSANNGGAIDNDQSNLTVRESLFEENVCLDYGGAIYNRYFATLKVYNSTFLHNQAIEDEGGVFYNYFKSTLIAENNTFKHNYAWNYAGIIFNDDSEATFTSNYIFNSTVGKFGGSVIYNANGAHATFEDNIIINNTAITNGGAVYTASSDIDLIDNIFLGNKARQGGALYFIGSNTNNVINNFIVDNVAETNGGAIYNTANQPLTVIGNLIENNIAGQGAALYSTGQVIFNENNVTDNNVTNPSSKVIYNTGTFTASGNRFLNNTDGNDILMGESGTNTVNDNVYIGNMLETNISDIEDASVKADFSYAVKITSKDVYNTVINTGKINVKINDEDYDSLDVIDGNVVVTLKINDLDDENTVTLEYVDETDSFQPVTTTFNIYNLRKDSIIVLDTIEDVEYLSNMTISGKFTDTDGNGFANSKVTVTVNGKSNYVKTDSEGNFIFTAPAKIIGTNNVTVSYGGSPNVNNYSVDATFEVTKAQSVIIIDDVSTAAYNDEVTVTGRFTDSKGNALSKSKLSLTVNGKKVTVTTDSTGAFSYTFKATVMGENTVAVSYGGSAKYEGDSSEITFEVTKAECIVTVDPIADAEYGSNYTITGTFKDTKGNALANSKIKLTINGHLNYVTTDSTGMYTFTYIANKVGVNNVTVAYAGSAKYAETEDIETTFNVIKKA